MNKTRLKALIVKEFFQIIRDPSSILISVLLPLVLMFVYGFGVSLDLDHVKIGLVLEESSQDAASFADSLCGSNYFDVTLARSRKPLEHDLTAGKIRGIVVVPAYFSRFKKTPETQSPLQVIADGSEPNTANFVQNYVRGAWGNWLQQEKVSRDLKGMPLVNVQTRYWYNEQLESRNFLIPGSLAIIMTLIGTLLTALVVAREWERGTMEGMLATPVNRVELLLGKFIPYYLLALFSMSICVFIAYFLYGIPLRGSLVLLWLVTSCFLFAMLSLGILVSTVSRSQLVAAQVALVIGFLPSFMLSGFIFEISSMPEWIQVITHVVPARYFVTCLQTLFLAGNVWKLILLSIIPMLMWGAILTTLILKKSVNRLD